ncbi:Phosphomevalonate kinase [Pleurotus pulmonarius]
MSTTVVSSPGKVLVAGGYLVLDPAYSGIVVSTSSRFYTVIQPTAASSHANQIQVLSPQFTQASWRYDVTVEPKLTVVPNQENSSKNKFVHLALESAILLATEMKGSSSVLSALAAGLDITIAGDNDFYSQRAKLAELNLPRNLESLTKIPPFAPTGGSLAQVHKTGLGSSAALITSLVSALLVHFSVISSADLSEDSEGRHLAHNLAQYVHCLAQGKVGSGFDVAAAVFGSHLYTRFDPSVLEDLMTGDTTSPRTLFPTLSPKNRAWNHKIRPFALPPLTRIMLADVDAGSDTPSLVGKVLKWRKENDAEAHALWTSIDQLNQSFASILTRISELHDRDPAVYSAAVKYLSSLQPVQWMANPWTPPEEEDIMTAFYDAHQTSEAIRAKMREMGRLSGVPIEPSEQTKLLDECVRQAGVIGGGVPGAGGFDAIWLLVCDPVDCSPDQRPTERIEYVWSHYGSVSPLMAVESKAKGSRTENIDDIMGLKDTLRLS